ncbi:hypothetical protein ACWGLG_16660 [Streptomyces antimycoticus]
MTSFGYDVCDGDGCGVRSNKFPFPHAPGCKYGPGQADNEPTELPDEARRQRWEAAALAVGREVDRNALRAYMAVADDEQAALRATLEPHVTALAADGQERLKTYAKIFRQLPREAAAELVAAMTTDPELEGRKTVIAQAALGTSVGHRLGWWGAASPGRERRL